MERERVRTSLSARVFSNYSSFQHFVTSVTATPGLLKTEKHSKSHTEEETRERCAFYPPWRSTCLVSLWSATAHWQMPVLDTRVSGVSAPHCQQPVSTWSRRFFVVCPMCCCHSSSVARHEAQRHRLDMRARFKPAGLSRLVGALEHPKCSIIPISTHRPLTRMHSGSSGSTDCSVQKRSCTGGSEAKTLQLSIHTLCWLCAGSNTSFVSLVASRTISTFSFSWEESADSAASVRNKVLSSALEQSQWPAYGHIVALPNYVPLCSEKGNKAATACYCPCCGVSC